jgi:excisionase family DNA binding protein
MQHHAVEGSILNIDELSGYLRIAKSSLYKLCQEGKVPGQKIGRHWRFRKEVVDKWLESGSDYVSSNSEGEKC